MAEDNFSSQKTLICIFISLILCYSELVLSGSVSLSNQFDDSSDSLLELPDKLKNL